MDFPGRHRRIRPTGLVAILFFLLTAGAAGAQETDTASIEFEPSRVVITSNAGDQRRRFTIQIRTSIPWGEEVYIDRPALDGPMVWWAYPYARSWVAETEDGGTARFVEVLASIRVDAPGFHTVNPFRITAGGRSAVTEAKEIIGLETDEADLPYPVFTGWRNPPETVWQGEAVPLILEARNLASLTLADTVNLASPPHGLLEEAPGMGGIITRPYGTEIIYDVPMASWIWTQAEAGTYRFPNVRTDISGMIRDTPGFPVEVRPVPEEALSSGAVGTFLVTYDVEPGPHRAGDVVSVRVIVEGEGNMNVLNPPIPEVSGAALVGQGSNSSYIPGPSGYRGWREERYDYQVEQTGDITVSLPDWTWFDPAGDGSIRRSVHEDTVFRAEEALDTGVDEERLTLLGRDIFRYPSAVFHWRNSHWFLLGLPGFLVLVVLFLLKRPGSGSGAVAAMAVLPLLLSASSTDARLLDEAATAAALAESGDWDSARTAYETIREETGDFPGLLHDIAIVEMELGHADTAVANMRLANRLRPGSPFIGRSLTILERHLSLEDQVPVPLRIPPAVMFAFLLVSINLAFLISVLLLYRRGARFIILTLSVVLVLAASIVGTVVVAGLWRQPTGVVLIDSEPLRKIPGPLATDWIQLPAGTALSIVASEGGDYLVRTGYGLEGWLPGSSLILIDGESDGL